MNQDRFKRLRELALFGALNDTGIEYLLGEASEKRVESGDTFFLQDDLGESMFVLLEGVVEVVREAHGRPRRLAVLAPGDCFGEMALIACAPRSATVRALDDAIGLELSFTRFHELYTVEPEQFLIVHMNMAREVCRRLHTAVDLLSETQSRLDALNTHGLYM